MVRQLKSFLTQGLVLGGLKVMVINAIGMALAYVTHMLFARWLGVEPYGYYVYALAWLNVLVTFVQLGLNTSTVRLTAELRARGDLTSVMGLSRFSTLVVLSMGFVVICVGGAFLFAVQGAGQGQGTASQAQVQALAVMLPLVVILSLLNQRMAILQGFERVAQAQAFLEIMRPAVLIGIMVVLFQFWPLQAHMAMAANLVATILALGAVAWVVMRFLNREYGAVYGGGQLERTYRIRTWLSVSLPYLGIGGLTVVMDQSDVLILGTLLGGVAAGLYLPAVKLSQLILFPMLAIRSHAAPLLAKLHAENNQIELQRQMNTTTVTSVLSGLVLVVLLLWQREMLLGLFGAEFVEAAPAVVILALGMAVFVFTGGVEVFLIIGPFERLTVLIYALVVAVNILLNLILIPLLGIVGAAYATAATIVLRGALSTFVVWREAGVLPWFPLSTDVSFGKGG